jgi:hypothetical protein
LSDSATACVDDAAALHVLSFWLSGPWVAADPGGMAVPVDLLDHLILIPDRRVRKWVEHPLAGVLALCAGAVVAGMCGFTAIAGWICDVPTDVLRSAYARCGRPGATSGEDNSTTRTGSGPRAMASLRNLAIGAIRIFGRNDITETTRWAHRDMRRPFQILGLT